MFNSTVWFRLGTWPGIKASSTGVAEAAYGDSRRSRFRVFAAVAVLFRGRIMFHELVRRDCPDQVDAAAGGDEDGFAGQVGDNHFQLLDAGFGGEAAPGAIAPGDTAGGGVFVDDEVFRGGAAAGLGIGKMGRGESGGVGVALAEAAAVASAGEATGGVEGG